MRLLPIQEAYARKFERQKTIPGLELHAAGHCAHAGRISPGCRGCFEPDPFRHNLLSGMSCNLDCVYCFRRGGSEPDRDARLRWKAKLVKDSYSPGYAPTAFSFSGGGEPLAYIETIRGYMDLLHQLEPKMARKPWYFLYTNGLLADHDTLLRLKDMGFDEIRFHPGASNFSRKVFRHMREAVRHFKAITVETPAWPPHRDQLFQMLPVLDDLGVKHLNLGEVEVTRANLDRILAVLPDAEIYPCYEMHLYDGGLVYDIIEEVIDRKYSFSVLDCNAFVKSIQRGPAKSVYCESAGGFIAEYVTPDPAGDHNEHV